MKPALKLLIVAVCAPVAATPALVAACPPESSAETLVWLYPFAIIGGGILAWLSWPQRRDVTWILLAIMLLTHIAIWCLVKIM